MYFPPNFDRELAIELGNLIKVAQKQYKAFKNFHEWQLPHKYSLIKELKYSTARINLFDKENKLTEYLQKLPLPKGDKPPEIPVGFFAEYKNKIFIIFRGTQTSTEWINNLNTKLTPFSINNAGNVHGGFFNLYMNVREEVLHTVDTLPQKAQMYITGHSLGSAFASFAAYDIEITKGCRIHSLYTFGSPRLGDNDFVTSFNKKLAERSFRIANSADIVTEVPFPATFAGLGEYFSHVETPIVFTTQNNDREENHHMDTYLSALSEAKDDPVKAFIRSFIHR